MTDAQVHWGVLALSLLVGWTVIGLVLAILYGRAVGRHCDVCGARSDVLEDQMVGGQWASLCPKCAAAHHRMSRQGVA